MAVAWRVFVLCLSFVYVSGFERAESRTVATTSGSVKGYKAEDADVFVFYGVPYATAPKGKDRFKGPLPAPKWLQALEAVDDSIVCAQNEQMIRPIAKNVTISEDCLVANIFTPYRQKKNLPVVVQVHGGAYQLGFGNAADPKSIVENGEVLFVTFNYRLGVAGFLCLGTDAVPGNAGMKDMVALLRWVKNNIANFGGNPEDVTITGYSAGASAVHHLVLSPAAKGLFHKAILESGTAISVWGTQQDPIEIARSYAGRNVNVFDLEDYYTTASIEDLFADTPSVMSREDSSFQFVPCVERDVGQQDIILKESPIDILKRGGYNKVPILIGHAHSEGLFRAELFDTWKERMNDKFSDFLPADMKFESQEEKESVANQIKKYYFDDKKVSEDTAQAYLDYFGDLIFVYPDVVAAYMHSSHNHPVYLYDYTFYESSPLNKSFPIDGAGHCAQTLILYDFTFAGHSKSAEINKVRSQIRQMWVNFVKTGKPTQAPEDWPPLTTKYHKYGSPYMAIGLQNQLKTEPMIEERVEFWNQIYSKYYRAPGPPPAQGTRPHPEL